ncbi:MAG: AMP-binding protein [Pseudomonadota bacterium]
MLKKLSTIAEINANFAWDIPPRFNIAAAVCDRWAVPEPARLAILDVDQNNKAKAYTYGELRQKADALAHGLQALSLGRGPIGVLLPQRFETAVAHIAIFKLGAISLPLFTLFGPEALAHRLEDSSTQALITDARGAAMIAALRPGLSTLKHVITVDQAVPNTAVDAVTGQNTGKNIGEYNGTITLASLCAGQDTPSATADTQADDPALLIYTSGTTGKPKGALHAHRVLLGHLPGVEMSHDFLPQPDDRIWTPADWAWIGGLLDVLMPALYHGVPVVARRFDKFTGEAALDLLRDQNIKNAFLPPTALKLMRQVPKAEDWGLQLRSVASGGEALGAELLEWGQRVLGTTINEFYGQTECNMIVSSCAALSPPEPGAMGYAVPGHDVAVIDPETGVVRPDGQEGEIAIRAPNPVMFLEYWNKPDATAAKFVEGPTGPDGQRCRWLKTGDRGLRLPSGRFKFIGRDDDVISSAGYRIGPAEIEDCLMRHDAVHMAGVVGQPDQLRGEIVAAYIVLAPGYNPSNDLAADIAQHVKTRLAAYEYPRVIRFIDQMPMTTTGKIIRTALRQMAPE